MSVSIAVARRSYGTETFRMRTMDLKVRESSMYVIVLIAEPKLNTLFKSNVKERMDIK